ncbi:hypothetical protein LXL04_029410 [Taraxacum kok-saghyz]
MNVRRPSRKETRPCSRNLRFESPPRLQVYDLAIVPHKKSQVRHTVEVPHTDSDEEDQGGSVTQDQVTQVEDVGVVQADGGYHIEVVQTDIDPGAEVEVHEQEFAEKPPEFHFEMPNIDDAFHYDECSLFVEFDVEYNNTDVLADQDELGVEESSVESGWRSNSKGNKDGDGDGNNEGHRDGDSSMVDSSQGTGTKGRSAEKKECCWKFIYNGLTNGTIFCLVNQLYNILYLWLCLIIQETIKIIFIFHTSSSSLFIALSKPGITTMALGHIGGFTHPMNPQFVSDVEHLQNGLLRFLVVHDVSLIAGLPHLQTTIFFSSEAR